MEAAQPQLFNFNGLQWSVNPEFNDMENEVVNQFLAELATTQEVNPKIALKS